MPPLQRFFRALYLVGFHKTTRRASKKSQTPQSYYKCQAVGQCVSEW
jgi:hypothetical protein